MKISRTLGEPLFDAISGGHQAVESYPFLLMTPPKGNVGAGMTLLRLTSRVAPMELMSVLTRPF